MRAEVQDVVEEGILLRRLIYVRQRVVGPRTLLLLKLKRSKITMLRVARNKFCSKYGSRWSAGPPKTWIRDMES